MNKSIIFLSPIIAFWIAISTAWAEPSVVEKDMDGDGRKETKVHYKKNNQIDKIIKDRNGDGKPDFRILEENGRLIEKQYDDNFDGKFEKTIKAPRKGTVLKVKTVNEQ